MHQPPSPPAVAAEELADALVGDDLEVVQAAAAAGRALAAWLSFPRAARAAYPGEARRLARRAASAVVQLVEAATGQEVAR